MGLRTFTFGGTVSSAYNMFITDAAPYNAPTRNVEMVSIPGRNGDFAVDQGSFSNVEVRYNVVVYGSNHSDFQTALSDVRNWLCSAQGYQRLSDDYNPNEYRMAIYKGGLETKGDYWNGAEFEITFECKPQRWLTSGETETAVANNGTLTNPTLFDASPLLTITGYGDIDMGGQIISVDAIPVGDVLLATAKNQTYQSFDQSVLDTGDTITIYGGSVWLAASAGTATSVSSISAWSGTQSDLITSAGVNSGYIEIIVTVPTQTFSNGTSASLSSSQTITYDNGKTTVLNVGWGYTGAGQINLNVSISGTQNYFPDWVNTVGDVHGDSTLTQSTVYIDLDVGESYKIVNGAIVSTNNAVTLPAKLPTLPSGSTTFTYDNTITTFKVTPRWWKV